LAQATTKKVRVFELAKTLGLETKAVLDYCRDLGYDVKNQLSSLEPDQIDAVKVRISKGGRPSAAAAVAPRPTVLPKVEKKIHTLPAAKKVEAAVVDEPAPIPEAEILPPEPPLAEPVPEPVAPPRPAVEVPTKVPTLVPSRPPAPEPIPAAVEPEPVATPAPPTPTRAAAEPVPPSPAASAEVPATATPPGGTQRPLPPMGPPRVQTIGGRPPAITPTRPSNLAPPRPGSGPAGTAPPRAPQPGAPLRPTSGPGGPAAQRPAGPPGTRPGAPAGSARPPAARPGAGPSRPGGPGGTGAPAGPAAPGDRHRRLPSQRTPGMARPGSAAAPGAARPGPQPPAGPAGRRFTREEIEELRKGRSIVDIKRQFSQPTVTTTKDEPEEEETKAKKGVPAGKGGEKDRRAVERARRTEQRKQVKAKDVVVEGGQVDLAEEPTFGSRRGPRAALLKKQRRQRLPGTIERKGKVPISLPITVRSLSEAIGMKAAGLLLKLKELTNALFTINSTVEVEVAELIAEEKGVELDIQKQKDVEDILLGEHEEAAGDESKLEPRAPIVTIMGHVDHGKTSLLDTIRKTYGIESDVVSSEAGGITQVIRAWRVEKDGKPITFLDTPGHEAFTKMRARGANVTDIAVIVVAADSGVQPQTEEAVSHAKAAGVSIVVAINKMDMPGADPAKVERQLYNLGLLPDTMGGDVQFVRTSAVKGTGIAELLETLSLVAELKELKANPHKPAQGTCLEAYLSGDEGVMATLLVQQGTLHRGDVIVCGATFGRVRAMYDDLGRPIQSAGPSVPVRITGLDEVPNADDHFHAVTELAKAREIAEIRKFRQQEAALVRFSPVTLDKLGAAKTAKIAELKVILKAEARGSVEAIRKELEKLVHDEVRVRVLHAGIGAITESDVQLALASPEDSIVVGFNVVPDDAALKLAEERGIPIREYTIIYKLTEDIKAALEGKLKPEERVIHLGRAVVRQTFKISKVGTAAGCYVTQGVIERSAKIRVIRDGAVIFPPGEKVAALESLKRFKDDVKEVKEGYDCGMKIAGYDDIKVGDVIEAYRIEQVQRTL
jgi:translation initiation factor IF-2